MTLIFRKILDCVRRDFNDFFEEDETIPQATFDVFTEAPEGHAVPKFLDIVWADDLAIVVTHKSPAVMLERLKYTISRTFHHCLRHALIPNFKRGKTEALLFLRGAGSKTLKQEFFTHGDPFLLIDDVPDDFARVLVSSNYRHLGSKVHLGKTILPEIKARLGAATAIYRKHSAKGTADGT